MNEYNYIPRPNIEHHYHIQELIDAQEKRANDRIYHRNKIKEQQDREDIIKDNKVFCKTDFWCDECKQDFQAQTIKEVEEDWSCLSQRIAFYKTKCERGHWCIRLITDRELDGFWSKSKKVSLDRGNHSNDTIQPFEIGFNMLYGKK